RIEGVDTNIDFLHDLLLAPDFIAGNFNTGFVDQWAQKRATATEHPRRYFESAASAATTTKSSAVVAPEGTVAVPAPMLGTVVSVEVGVGAEIFPGQLLAVIE